MPTEQMVSRADCYAPMNELHEDLLRLTVFRVGSMSPSQRKRQIQSAIPALDDRLYEIEGVWGTANPANPNEKRARARLKEMRRMVAIFTFTTSVPIAKFFPRAFCFIMWGAFAAWTAWLTLGNGLNNMYPWWGTLGTFVAIVFLASWVPLIVLLGRVTRNLWHMGRFTVPMSYARRARRENRSYERMRNRN